MADYIFHMQMNTHPPVQFAYDFSIHLGTYDHLPR